MKRHALRRKCKLLACQSSTVAEKKQIFRSRVKFMIWYINSKEASLELQTLLRTITENKSITQVH